MLKLRDDDNEASENGIIKMAKSDYLFVKSKFYRDEFNEIQDTSLNLNYKTIPIKMTAINCGWIMRCDDGKELLTSILVSDNIELFKTPYLQMIIGYLFSKLRVYLLAQ